MANGRDLVIPMSGDEITRFRQQVVTIGRIHVTGDIQNLSAKSVKNSENALRNISSPPILNPKPFIWDSVIIFFASTIFGFSVSGVIAELFKSEQNSVTCFTELENRAQYVYINNYCYNFLPNVELFPAILVLHAAALVIPHYLWRVIFSAKLEFFFSHAAKIETLRNIYGEIPKVNFKIAEFLKKEFDNKVAILKAYVAKLFLQLLLVLNLIAINVTLLNKNINFSITFDCNDNDERSQLFGNVTCAYPRKIFIDAIQVADNIILVLAMFVLVYGLFWCLFYNNCSNKDQIAQFCYDSCTGQKHYRSPKISLGFHQLKDDLDFLLTLLSRTNTGLGRVFKKILVKCIIYKKFNHEKNRFIKCESNQDEVSVEITDSEENNLEENNSEENNSEENKIKQFSKIIMQICKKIRKDENSHALNIGTGHHSYLFSIACWKPQNTIISVMMTSSSEDKDELNEYENHRCISTLKIPKNLFALPKLQKTFFKKMESCINESSPQINLVVVGALSDENKVTTLNVIIGRLSAENCIADECVMLILHPVTIGGLNVFERYKEWKPESNGKWHEEKELLKSTKDVINIDGNCGEIKAICGNLICKFKLKTFTYKN